MESPWRSSVSYYVSLCGLFVSHSAVLGVLRSRLMHYNEHIMRLAVTVEVKLVTMVD